MKEKFIDTHFSQKRKGLLRKVEEIMDLYDSQGYYLTVRQLYYQLVAKNIVENSIGSYKSLVDLVRDGRYAGLLDWDIIRDRNRSANRPAHWGSVRDFLDEIKNDFAIDKWEDQQHYIEVMVEKDALSGVLGPVCTELSLTLSANKGFSSASAFYRAGKRFQEQYHLGKDLHIFYLGDHDPSGCFMTDDVINRVKLLGGNPIDLDDDRPFVEELPIEIHRLALNMEQIHKLNPPKNPAKQNDPRAKAYVKKYGPDSWELDAVEPKALAELVTEAVKPYRDEKLWDESVKKEKKLRTRLNKLVSRCKF
jgi:hypothetical protein